MQGTTVADRAPKLRADLVVSEQDSSGEPCCVVKDPLIGRFFRFKAVEYFIAQQLDGETPLDIVRRRTEEKFGVTVPSEALGEFVAKLKNLGLLEVESLETEPRRGGKRGRFGGSVLYLRFKAIDPDHFLEWLVRKLGVLFSPTFVIASAAMILLAGGITLSQWPAIRRDLHQLLHFGALFLAWLTLVGVVVCHEFAHGLTCKRFGGRVNEIGFILIFFQPSMYCNVSDAWLFTDKSKRLWVTFAGAYFEIFLWALATLTWRLTDPTTLVSFLALVVMATSGIKTLFNLNPLIKLDGYYLLSDWLEIPNLRRKAFGYLAARLGGLFGHTSPLVTGATVRERRIYLTYSLLAGVYSTWLLSVVLLSLGRFLVAKYQGWGFLAFAALAVAILQRPLKRAGHFAASLFTARRGIVALMKRLVKIVALLAVVSAALYFVHSELKVSGEFKILPIRNAEVRAEVEGVIEEIPKDEGEAVSAGEVMARLSDRDYQSELRQVKAQIEEKAARLKMLKAGTRAEEIELARTTVAKAEALLKYAEDYREMEKNLFELKLSSRKEYEEAQERVTARAKELEEAQGQLKLLLAGSRPEEIEATEAEITRLTALQQYLGEQLQRLQIVSPIAGVIVTHRLKENVGKTVKKGDLIAVVNQMQTVTAEISISEKDIHEVHVGQRVMLTARALPQTRFEGQVVAIAPVASKPADGIGDRQFLVTTRLNNADLLLRPEMSGNAKIYCGTHRLYQNVFRRFVRYFRVEFWSWW